MSTLAPLFLPLLSCFRTPFLAALVVLSTQVSVANLPERRAPPPEENFDDSELVAMAHAAINDDASSIDKLAKQGVNVNAIGKNGVPMLGWALLSRSEHAFNALLDHRADPMVSAKGIKVPGNSVYAYAAAHEAPAFLDALLKHHADINAIVVPEAHWTPLWLAVDGTNLPNISYLLEHGADANVASSAGTTPLMLAAFSNMYDVVLQLLQHGVDYKSKDKNGNTLPVLLKSYASLPNIDHSSKRWKEAEEVARWLHEHGTEAPSVFLENKTSH